MTAKARDRCNRWRSVTVAFRMSPEENEHLNHLVQLSGMTKQDYIIARLLQKEIVVHGNPRVYKALKDRMDPPCKAGYAPPVCYSQCFIDHFLCALRKTVRICPMNGRCKYEKPTNDCRKEKERGIG